MKDKKEAFFLIMLSFLKMSYSQSISEARQHARDPNDALSMRARLLKVTPHGE
jgi:hypothetical protein